MSRSQRVGPVVVALAVALMLCATTYAGTTSADARTVTVRTGQPATSQSRYYGDLESHSATSGRTLDQALEVGYALCAFASDAPTAVALRARLADAFGPVVVRSAAWPIVVRAAGRYLCVAHAALMARAL